MNRAVLLLIMLSVTISAVAQIALKAGMSDASIQRALAMGPSLSLLAGVALNPFVLAGLTLYFCGAIVWLMVLAKVQVSTAYPFVALGFVITALLGRFFFGDTFSFAKIAGTLLIGAGVVVLARG